VDFESRLTTISLNNLYWGASVRRILGAALRAVEPGAAVKRWMRRQGDSLWVAGREYSIQRYQRVLIVGIGKAAVPMGNAVSDILGSDFTEGILLTKDGYAQNQSGRRDLTGFRLLKNLMQPEVPALR
jgi:glycerate-2-kinase